MGVEKRTSVIPRRCFGGRCWRAGGLGAEGGHSTRRIGLFQNRLHPHQNLSESRPLLPFRGRRPPWGRRAHIGNVCAVVVVVVVADGKWLNRASNPASLIVVEYFSSRVPVFGSAARPAIEPRSFCVVKIGCYGMSPAVCRRPVQSCGESSSPAKPERSLHCPNSRGGLLRGDFKCAPDLHR